MNESLSGTAMRYYLLPMLALAATLPAVAQYPPKPPADPPGVIVIRPKTTEPPTIVPPGEPGKIVINRRPDPDRPGVIEFRPSGRAVPYSTELPSPRENGGVPHISIIRPKPTREDPDPDPLPLPGAKGTPLPQPVPAPEPPKADPSVLYETWDAAFCRGYKVGYFHVVVREFTKNDKKVIYATKEMKLTIARFGQAVETWAEDTTIETPTGEIVVAKMAQGIGKNQMLNLTGRVTDKGLEVSIEGSVKDTKTIPWPAGVLGVSREAKILQEKKPKPGETVQYLWWEGRLNHVVKFTATAKPVVEVVVRPGQKPRKLIPVVSEMDTGNAFKLPPATAYCDPETYQLVKMESDMPTLGGKLEVFRTTREAALRAPARRLDIAEAQSIKLNRDMTGIQAKAGAVYTVTLGGDIPVDKAFPSDDRQQVKNVDAKARTLELHVTAVRQPVKPDAPAVRPGKDYLADCFFIDWDNDATKKHAAAAVARLPGNASDWQKAQAVERYVHANMKAAEFSQAMATCSNVAKSLSGDCTEFSVFAAGLCRALGVPSRTAIGVIAVPDQRANQSVLAWHMWFEVWVEGKWLALDGTLGQGSVGPGHIKISEASWFEEKSFAPLMPVLMVLGTRPKVDVLKVTDR